MRRTSRPLLALPLTLLTLLAGCGGRAFVHEPVDSEDIQGRAESQTIGQVRVAAAVPGREEADAIFGVKLYDQGIQPVWLEIENRGPKHVRYAISSTDSQYFSPNEVAYKNRRGYSDEARAAMEQYFDGIAMPRYVPAGETRSGFVFTHAATGAKGFNVDLFTAGKVLSFTYLLRVPGFVPDYANLDFQQIYAPDQVKSYAEDELPEVLKSLPCCTTQQADKESGEPINVFLIGKGNELLRALLRSGWTETSEQQAAASQATFLFGRSQDAIFRYSSLDGDSYYEMRAWRTPILSGDVPIWACQVRHFFKRGLDIHRVDPDVDNARSFALQNFLYGQALQKYGWLEGHEVVPVESFWENLFNKHYFTTGYRVAMWLSADPVSLLDVQNADWDNPPGWTE